MGERDHHIRLGAAPEFDGAEPDLVGDRANKARIGREVLARADDVRLQPRHRQLLAALGVDEAERGDRGRLPEQPDEIVTLLFDFGIAPFDARCPTEFGLDFVEEHADPLGGRARLFGLHFERGALGLTVAEPSVDSAVDDQHQRHEADEAEGELGRKRQSRDAPKRRSPRWRRGAGYRFGGQSFSPCRSRPPPRPIAPRSRVLSATAASPLRFRNDVREHRSPRVEHRIEFAGFHSRRLRSP